MNNSLKIIAVGVLSMFVTSAAIAGGAIGITVSAASIDASGHESLKTTANKTTHSTSKDVVIASIFVENTNDEHGVTIGIDYIPYNSEAGSGSNTGDDDIETSGTNTVNVDFKHHVTIYVEKTVGDLGLYVKAGLSQVTLVTNDSLSTGAKYPNEDMSGYVLGVGVKRDLADGLFFKVAGERTSYDGATFKSTGSDAVTTVELLELDVTQARLSIGKSF